MLHMPSTLRKMAASRGTDANGFWFDPRRGWMGSRLWRLIKQSTKDATSWKRPLDFGLLVSVREGGGRWWGGLLFLVHGKEFFWLC